MKTAVNMLALCVVSGVVACGAEPATPALASWPQWRGPLATGAAPDANPPVSWAEDSNVRWKIALPGKGHSSPVVWQDRVFLTTAVETDKTVAPDTVKAAESATPAFHRSSAHLPQKVLQFVVLAVGRTDGRVLWQQTVCEEAPFAATHADGSWASGSPVTDGQTVYAYFGSHGLYALDIEGKRKWEKRLGVFKIDANFGDGTSPVLCGDKLILSQDYEGASFIVALDAKTGAERWRVPRDEATSWATPLVVAHEGKQQVIVSATKRIRSYDAATGALLWEAAGMTGNVIPCPVAEKGLVFCTSGFRGSALMAIRLDRAAGDLATKPDALAWSRQAGTPYVPSPLLYGGLLYYLKVNSGSLTCVEAGTGKVQYEGRELDGVRMVYASPVGAAGRVYVTSREGLTCVLRQGPALEVLARNKLDDNFTASAALAGGDLILRGQKSLYCLTEEKTK